MATVYRVVPFAGVQFLMFETIMKRLSKTPEAKESAGCDDPESPISYEGLHTMVQAMFPKLRDIGLSGISVVPLSA